MKSQARKLLGFALASLFGLTLSQPLPVKAACHYLTNQHADLRVTFTAGPSNQFGLVFFDHESNTALRTNEVTILAGPQARLTLPPGTPFGAGGSPIWILPQNQNTLLPYLGTSAVGVPPSALAGSQLEIRLKRVEGPGHFLLWQTLGPGQFDIQMDSRDGITAADVYIISLDGHAHHSWGFTTSGLYRITFQAAGVLAGQSQPSAGVEHTFIFHILPLKPFEDWQAAQWPCECRPQIVGPQADPDGDGLVNVAEYALGTNPNLADSAPRPQIRVVQFEGHAYGALTYLRNKAATDVTFLPARSAHLGGGIWQPLTLLHSVEDLGARERVTWRDALPLEAAPQGWYQLRLQWSP